MNRSQVYTNLLTGLGNQLLSDPDEQNNNQYSLKQGILESIPYLFGNTYSPISNVQQQNYLNKEGNKNGGSMGRIRDIINTTNPFQQNGVSAGLIPGTVQYQQENPQKTTLQEIYNQAMSKTTPSWVTALNNAIPSIAQIGALGATKGAFNQGYVADSLERQKQRQQAYNQLLQQQEQNKVKDFVQMAKDQMNIDRADDDTAYNRDLTASQIEYKKIQDEIANRLNQDKFDFAKEQFDNQKRQQEIDNKHWEIQDTYNKDKAEQDKIQRETENRFKNRALTLQENEAANKPILEQQKAEQEQLKKNQERAFNLINSNSVTPALGNLMLNNPELMPYLKDSGKYSKAGNMLGFLPWKVGGNDNKFDFNYEQYLIDNGIPVTKQNIKELKKQLGL